MLTPAFDLSQDAEHLIIVIKARFAKVSEVEIFVDGNDFKFYAKPYFLRLHLPGRVIEDGRERAKYDVDAGSFEISLPKETPGEAFEGLDMLTTLLAPRGQRSAEQPSIEVTGDGEEAGGYNESEEDDQGEIDWQVEQRPFQQEEDSLLGETTYGFANKRSGVFKRLQEELCGIVDVPDPDTTQLMERKESRVAAENSKFDPDHYLADLYQDDSVMEELLSYKPPWHQEWRDLQAKSKQTASKPVQVSCDDEETVQFTEDEKEQMRRLPRRHHLLDPEQERSALLSLVDIIYAYAYNARTTLGENSVESAWTICKLSPTLSWLDWFTCLDEVVRACYRRALCYPLYRHWKLANKVFQDVRRIFLLGRRRLVKCLLEIHRVLAAEEPHYILNELYVTDYCVWIQSLGHGKIASLAEALKKVKITKDKIGFELEELELAAELATREQRDQDAASPVHQYGYPDILHAGSSVDENTCRGGEGSSAATNETEVASISETEKSELETRDGSPAKVQKGQAHESASTLEPSVEHVASRMADLKLCKEDSDRQASDEKSSNSAAHSSEVV